MYAAVKAANPNWQPGQPFDSSILDSVTRELVESNLVQSGNQFVRRSIDYSVHAYIETFVSECCYTTKNGAA